MSSLPRAKAKDATAIDEAEGIEEEAEIGSGIEEVVVDSEVDVVAVVVEEALVVVVADVSSAVSVDISLGNALRAAVVVTAMVEVAVVDLTAAEIDSRIDEEAIEETRDERGRLSLV